MTILVFLTNRDIDENTIKIIISKKNKSLFSFRQKEHKCMAVNHYDIIELVYTRSCDYMSPDRLASAKRQEKDVF